MRIRSEARYREAGLRTVSGALLLVLLCGLMAGPAAAFTVFTCEPEWAALTRVMLPDARVHVATHSEQDPHHIEARPALIAQLRQADLAVCTGASLEAGWLPKLLQRSGNARVQDVLFASDHVNMIDPQPGAIGTPWAGDVHAEGNPHVHLDPRNLLLVANALAVRLQVLIPMQKAAIEKRRATFEVRWKSQLTQWQQRAMPLRGRQVAAQHTTVGYLWDWLGIKQTADLEPKPGMTPTPGHLQRLLAGLQPKPPMAVVVASYQDARPGKWLTAQLGSGVPLLVLPATVAEDADAEDLLRWMDSLLSSLLGVALQ